jgi:hypothetical protein
MPPARAMVATHALFLRLTRRAIFRVLEGAERPQARCATTCWDDRPSWGHLAKGRIKYAKRRREHDKSCSCDAIDCASSEAHLAVCKSLIISQ